MGSFILFLSGRSSYRILFFYYCLEAHHNGFTYSIIPPPPPPKNTTQCKLPKSKAGICASGWKAKHHASCNDYCIVHSTSTGADPELVSGGGGWSCMHCCCILFRLARVVLCLPPTGADTGLTLGQLALCGGVFWWWWC